MKFIRSQWYNNNGKFSFDGDVLWKEKLGIGIGWIAKPIAVLKDWNPYPITTIDNIAKTIKVNMWWCK